MTEQPQGNEFDEVGVQDLIDGFTQEISKLTRERIVADSKVKRLIPMVEEARDVIGQLNDEVSRLTALLDAKPSRKAPADRKPRGSAKPVEVVAGEVVEDGPVQDA